MKALTDHLGVLASNFTPTYYFSSHFYLVADSGYFHGWRYLSLGFWLLFMNHHILPPMSPEGFLVFFLGALSYSIIKRRYKYKPLNNSKVIFTFFEISILTAIYIMMVHNVEHGSIILSVLFAICVSVFSLQNGLVSRVLLMRPFTIAGKLSYSIYMIHAAIILSITSIFIVAQKITGIELTKIVSVGRVIDTGNVYMNTLLALFIITVVMILSAITYKYIEEPFINLGKKIQNKRSMKNVLVCHRVE